jgi:aconitate hydratase
LTFENPEDYDKIDSGDLIVVENVRENLKANKPLTIKDVTKGIEIKATYELSERQRRIILDGGLLNHVKQSVA